MYCAKCKMKVPLLNGVPVRPCTCAAPIVAEMKATAQGHGGVR